MPCTKQLESERKKVDTGEWTSRAAPWLLSPTGLFLYLRPYHNPWIKKAKKLLGCAQDFRLENWILVEWIDKTQTLPKLSLENLGRVCVLPIHSTTFQFSNLKSWAHPYNFFAFLIHGLWFGRSYKNRPVILPNMSLTTIRGGPCTKGAHGVADKRMETLMAKKWVYENNKWFARHTWDLLYWPFTTKRMVHHLWSEQEL